MNVLDVKLFYINKLLYKYILFFSYSVSVVKQFINFQVEKNTHNNCISLRGLGFVFNDIYGKRSKMLSDENWKYKSLHDELNINVLMNI